MPEKKCGWEQLMVWLSVFFCVLLGIAGKTQAASFGVLNTFSEEVSIKVGGYNGNYSTGRDTLYYYRNTDGSLGAVNYINGNLKIFMFSSDGSLSGTKMVTLPLPVFGGYYHGSDGNHYVAVGQDNYDESRTLIVCKILKFDASWTLLGTADIPGGITNLFVGIYQIFRCSQARMTLYGNCLICHTGRTMFVSGDGLHHQSDITFAIDTRTMRLLDSYPQPYSSHSFAQFVETDGSSVYFLNHGDAFPRDIMLTVYSDYLGPNSSGKSTYLFPLLGETGENYTGTTVNGFALGDNGNLITGLSVPHGNAVQGVTGYQNVKQNIYVIITSRDGSTSRFKWLTEYTNSDSITVKEPRLARVSGDRFAILFQETRDGNEILRYFLLDSQGNILSKRNYLGMSWDNSSDPICQDGRIMWLTKEKNTMQWQFISCAEQQAGGLECAESKLYLTSAQNAFPVRVAYNPDAGDHITFRLDGQPGFSFSEGRLYFEGDSTGTTALTITNGSDTATVSCTGLVLSEQMLILEQGKVGRIELLGLADETLTYSVDKPEIAKVDQNGLVTGISSGIAAVKISVGGFDLQYRVYVKKQQERELLDDGTLFFGYDQIIDKNKNRFFYTVQGSVLHFEGDISPGSKTNSYVRNGGFFVETGTDEVLEGDIDENSFSGDLDFSTFGLTEGKHTIWFYVQIPNTGYGYVYGRFYSLNVLWKDGRVQVYGKQSLESGDITVDCTDSVEYSGKEQKPAVTVKYLGQVLKEGRDYDLYYKNNVKVGTATVTVRGKGSFTGSRAVTFKIIKKDTETEGGSDPGSVGQVKNLKASKVTGKTVSLKWKAVSGAQRYVVYGREYGKGSFAKLGTVKSASFKISKLKKASLKAGMAYQFRVVAQKKIKGKWTSGTKAQITVITTPNTPSVSGTAVGKGKLKLTWKKVSGVSGYQIYLSQKKNSGYKKAAAVKSSAKSATVSGLKRRAVYYVKLRSYKKVAGMTTYSSFTKPKKVKVK